MILIYDFGKSLMQSVKYISWPMWREESEETKYRNVNNLYKYDKNQSKTMGDIQVMKQGVQDPEPVQNMSEF